MVIFLPICQRGWFKASAGVTVDKAALRLANGPPEAVKKTREISCVWRWYEYSSVSPAKH